MDMEQRIAQLPKPEKRRSCELWFLPYAGARRFLNRSSMGKDDLQRAGRQYEGKPLTWVGCDSGLRAVGKKGEYVIVQRF